MAEPKISNLMLSVPVPAALAAIAAGRPAVPRKGPAPARILHVLNGDCAADQLGRSGVQGEITLSADVLHEGPAPAGLLPERWRKVRARYLAECGYGDYDRCLADLTEWDRALESSRGFDEVVIWLEHDLFDQLQLLRLLDWFGSRDDLGSSTRLSLICIGSFPGIEPFHGLGQLSPAQMASLLDRREPVSEKQIFLARHAWRAFCAPEPIGLEVALRRDTSALPFLADALQRHLEEFPWTRDGLSRTERQVLLGIDSGFDTFESLFRAVQALESRPFLGDSSFLRCLKVLASSPMPLLRMEPGPGGLIRNLRLSLTGTGREVLERREDWVQLHGIDRWLGGVHLHGREAQWRWDGERSRLVPAG
ncbi:MAG TPA: hypothetical protein VH394_22655 [Thermoanaerobaculia bacterium]|jgi:hypothetical protein|nr:hypothetical protein [Thermoanaerobaculia bacterium]